MFAHIQNETGRLGNRLSALPAHKFAAFFAYWGERLFPLYEEFEQVHQCLFAYWKVPGIITLKKAQELGVKILREEELLELLRAG